MGIRSASVLHRGETWVCVHDRRIQPELLVGHTWQGCIPHKLRYELSPMAAPPTQLAVGSVWVGLLLEVSCTLPSEFAEPAKSREPACTYRSDSDYIKSKHVENTCVRISYGRV